MNVMGKKEDYFVLLMNKYFFPQILLAQATA